MKTPPNSRKPHNGSSLRRRVLLPARRWAWWAIYWMSKLPLEAFERLGIWAGKRHCRNAMRVVVTKEQLKWASRNDGTLRQAGTAHE